MKIAIIKKWFCFNEINRLVQVFILLYFLSVASVVGQDKNTIHLDLDFAQFRLRENVAYLEVYYSIPRETISHEKVTQGYRGAFQIAAQILKNDSLLLTDTLHVEDRIDSLKQISPGQKFAELSMFRLANGSYSIKSELLDLVSKNSITKIDSVTIASFSYDTLTLSAIELASSIRPQKQSETKFDKNGLRIIPNAERIYGKQSPNLCFYAEAYNFLWHEPARASQYQVSYKVKAMNGTTALAFAGKKKNKPGPTSVIYGSIDVSELVTGSYILALEVTDCYDMKLARAEKQFFIYNKTDFMKEAGIDRQIAHADIQKYQQMDNDELDSYFKQLKYIADKDEIKIYKDLALEGKRNFFISFWSRRDPNPDTAINEYEIQYNDLINIATEKYSSMFKAGWESDRGRVLLLYGLPDTKDFFPTSTESRAYEIWEYYNIEGGVKFIFVDKRQNGDYELVHSTKRGEISDPDWRMNHARL